MMNLVIDNNLKPLKKTGKKCHRSKRKRNILVKRENISRSYTTVCIMCGHQSIVELLVKYQSFDFLKEVGEDSPDIYSLKLAPEISEEQLNQKMEELQLICAVIYS
jgi:hypothetical protein